ncbi:hypothetical protein Hanom_Chr16g01515721 [Helianthus anomalus]
MSKYSSSTLRLGRADTDLGASSGFCNHEYNWIQRKHVQRRITFSKKTNLYISYITTYTITPLFYTQTHTKTNKQMESNNGS